MQLREGLVIRIDGFAHQVNRADLDIIVEAYQIRIRANGDLTLDAGITAMTGGSLGCHPDGAPQGDACLLVDGAYQPVAGCHAAQETVSCRGFADTVLNEHLHLHGSEIETFGETKFCGSLPAFVAAVTKHPSLSEADLDEVQRMIDRMRKGG